MKPDYVIGVTIDATLPVWKLHLRLVRRRDGRRLAETSFEANVEDLSPLMERVSKEVKRFLNMHAGVTVKSPPEWYLLPTGYYGSDYLLRLEQQLTVACKNLDFLKGGELYGEREMLDGILQLCVDQPKNPTVRMLFAQTLRLMKKARPDILSEYKDKTAHLQRDYPITGIDSLIDRAINEAFVAET